MRKKTCCDEVYLNRGRLWSLDEDHKLVSFIIQNGIRCWKTVPQLAGLQGRCGKSCRLRWFNYLRPGLIKQGFTEKEDRKLIKLHSSYGNKWSKIAAYFPGRTDNEIKNHWHTRITKKLKKIHENKTHPVQEKKQKPEIVSLDSDGMEEMSKPEEKREDDKATSWDEYEPVLIDNARMLCVYLDENQFFVSQQTKTSTVEDNTMQQVVDSRDDIEENTLHLQQRVDNMESKTVSWDSLSALEQQLFILENSDPTITMDVL